MSKSAISILTPFDIGGRALRNRLAVAPMARVSATLEGIPTDQMTKYYARYARGGFGLVISEGTYTDSAFSQAYPNQPGLVNEAQARAWARITSAVQAHGARMFAQIMHAGALAQGRRMRPGTVAPSPIKPVGQQMSVYYGDGDYQTPAAITESQLADAIEGFAGAASLAVNQAGFDGVEIHAANGYLLDQFLTENLNQRSDRWGGTTAQRLSLSLEVLQAVKQRVAGFAPVGVRISQGKVNDFGAKWSQGVADAEVIFGSLEDAGVAYIHVTEFEAWQPAFPGTDQSLAALARRFAPSTPLIVNGSLHNGDRIRDALVDGADVVAIGRGALANPDFASRLAKDASMREFDPAILGSIANIKQSELELCS